jgi:hypothetical protein
MVALADINATLQEQNQTLDSVNKNLVAMLRADLNAAKRDARESGRRREREREANQKNRVATSQLGAGAAFRRGLIGDGLGGAIDKLMAGALGGLAGLIPLAMAGAGRGIRFGAAALVANAFIEDALNYAFDNFPGFEGLDNLQRKEFLDKATTGMNAAFIARFMGAKMPATIAAALGAAYAKEIGQFIGGTVDENGNLTIKNPVDGLLTSLGYEDILPKEFKLGPLELQAVGAVGAVIMTGVISKIFRLMRFIPAGRMLGLLGTLGLAGFDDLVRLINQSNDPIPGQRGIERGRTQQPTLNNRPNKVAPSVSTRPNISQLKPPPVTPYAGFGTTKLPTVGERFAAPEGTRRINPIFESNRPLTGQSLRSVAQSGGPAPYVPTNQYPLPPSMEQALQGSRAYNNLKLLAKALIKIAGPALTAYLVFEICRIVLGVGPYKGASEKEKTAMIGQLLGGFLQGTLLVMLAAALGGVGVTAITGGTGAGWGTLLGAIAGGGIAYFTPNFMGEAIAAWMLGQSSVEYERKVTQLQSSAYHADMAYNLTGTSVLAGEDAGKKAAMIMGMGGGIPIPFLNIQGGNTPEPSTGYATPTLSTNPYVAQHQLMKAARQLQKQHKAYNIDGEGFFGAPVGNTVIINQADNSDKSVKASNTQVGNSTRAAAIDYSTLSMYGEARLFGSGAMWANGQLNTPLY